MKFNTFERNLDDIVETLKSAKKVGKKCTILVGAGCSVSAGIPPASGIVEDIRKEFPQQWNRAEPINSDIKSYASCMEQLAPDERRNFLSKYIKRAGLNWAHICLAKLIQEEYVDRILTTNFDPLVLDSCALFGFTPAVYDVTSYPNKKVFKPSVIPDKAIFYLHGQYTGFNLINTTEEGKKIIPNLTPFFNDSLEGRTWLVVGYSGENDPVFNMLSHVSCFQNKLYWICFRSEPDENVKKKLLKKNKYAFFVPNMDADTFFIQLTQKLECFPEITTKPFSHLKKLLGKIKTYKLQQKEEDLTKYALELIEKAIKNYEVDELIKDRLADDNLPELMYAKKLLSEGKYDQILNILTEDVLKESDEWKKIKAEAYFFKGNDIAQKASSFKGKDKDKYFDEAIVLFDKAINLNPDFAEVFYNKGYIFWEKSYYSNHSEQEKLISDAKMLFETAYHKNSKLLDALFNMGTLTYEEALRQQDEKKKEKMLNEAIVQFNKALKINRWDVHSLYNKGLSLLNLAILKSGEKKLNLLSKVITTMDEIIKIDSKNSSAFGQKGLVYAIRAENTENNEKKEILYNDAIKFLNISIQLDSTNVKSYENLGKIYMNYPKIKSIADVEKFFDQAIDAYDSALAKDPNSIVSLNGKGLAILEKAKSRTNNEKESLLKQAIELFERIEKLQIGQGAYNIACANALLGNEEECKKWLEASKKYKKLPGKADILKDSDLTNYIGKEWFIEFINNI